VQMEWNVRVREMRSLLRRANGAEKMGMDRMCVGVGGDCCNTDGKCGTGPPFCVYGVC
jgi:hypothetical protein